MNLHEAHRVVECWVDDPELSSFRDPLQRLLHAAEAVLALQEASDAATKGEWHTGVSRRSREGTVYDAANEAVMGDPDYVIKAVENATLTAAAVNLVRDLLEGA